MAKTTDYAAVTTLLEAMWFYTAIDTDIDGNFESRKVSMASMREHLLMSQVVDSATAVAFQFDTANALSTTGYKLASWKNNGVETVYLDENGYLSTTFGTEEVYISHTDMTPPTTNGAALVSLETTAGRPDLRGYAFDQTTNENAEFEIALPKRWARGTITARFYWSTVAASSNTVIWGIQLMGLSDSNSIDTAYAAGVEVTDASKNSTERLHISDATAAITVSETPQDGDMIFARIYRDAATDTLAADAVLMGVKLFITTDAPMDD